MHHSQGTPHAPPRVHRSTRAVRHRRDWSIRALVNGAMGSKWILRAAGMDPFGLLAETIWLLA